MSKKEMGSDPLMKEEIPGKKVFSDLWMNLHQTPPKQGRQLEAADAQDSLMGRLASRMAARDMIDELDLGPKGKSPDAKKASVADNSDYPTKMTMSGPAVVTGKKIEKEHKDTIDKVKKNPKMDNEQAYEGIAKDHLKEHPDYYNKDKGLPAMEKGLKKNEISSSAMPGAGLHQQTMDLKASNMSDPISTALPKSNTFSNPIPEGKPTPGANMADQAKYQGNVYNTMHKNRNIYK